MFDKLVKIIGAGPGGLTLARLLQLRGIPVRIFEHDLSFLARDQGGTLDLHDDGGQKALISAKLFDEFKKVARPEGQSIKIIDKNGKIHYDEVVNSDDMSRPEIDRQTLRNILLNSLKPNTVAWNKHVTNIESIGNGQHNLVFKDGTNEITDFLVGADGTWSKVRPLLSSGQPVYTGVTFVETRISNPKVASPYISKLVGEGTASVLSEWQTQILEILTCSDDYFMPRHIYTLPIEQHWSTKPGVTLIGDAAHVMTPFAGIGVNLAMLDALELADCLTLEGSGNITKLTTSLKNFEKTMINRARVFSEEALNNQNTFIREDAPRVINPKSEIGPQSVILGTIMIYGFVIIEIKLLSLIDLLFFYRVAIIRGLQLC